MNDKQQHPGTSNCGCAACPGQHCPCGCQQGAATTVCACGPQCKCGAKYGTICT